MEKIAIPNVGHNLKNLHSLEFLIQCLVTGDSDLSSLPSWDDAAADPPDPPPPAPPAGDNNPTGVIPPPAPIPTITIRKLNS